MAPRVLARDPGYLCSSALFKSTSNSESKTTSLQNVQHEGALRKVAHRGTELFVAVGNELRWSDCNLLRDADEGRHGGRRSGAAEDGTREGERTYRLLKTPVARPITQLTVSPSGDYLAILTSHTVHICILPSPSHLHAHDPSPLRLKSFHLGPTTHVLEQSPLVSALWHPLAPSGDCLVTVTHDACVRLWELDSTNRSTFSEPALAVDLKKLANATSTQADFSASKYGTNRAFSPDDVEMQVAAACFGGQGGEDEHGWAGMTLWVAMTEGDVYALCPFLPSRWKAPGSLLGSLSTSVLEKEAAQRRDADISESERRAVEQQRKWLAEIDAQDPLLLPGTREFETVEVYARPAGLSAVPKLQGPFIISPEPEFGEITDIHAIAPKIDSDALYDDEDGEEEDLDGSLSVGIVCLATSTNEVHTCLCLSPVEAQWLPSKRSRSTYALDDVDDVGELLLFETIDLAQDGSGSEDNGYPTFTPSPANRHGLFVTHPTGVCALDFSPWVTTLEDELANPADSGVAFRLDILLESAKTAITEPISFSTPTTASSTDADISTAIVIQDPAAGSITLLTLTPNTIPYATVLDIPSPTHPFAPDAYDDTPLPALPAPDPRAPYRPPPSLDATNPSSNFALRAIIQRASDTRSLGADGLKAPVRFSPAVLQLLTEAHRVMARETHGLGVAAAGIFRTCERMRAELAEQVRKVAEVAQRVDDVVGEEDDDDGEVGGDGGEGGVPGAEEIDRRIERAQERTAELGERYERLRRKMARCGGAAGSGQELSAREKAFGVEVARLERSVLPHGLSPEAAASVADEEGLREDEGGDSASSTLAGRVEAVERLQQQLVRQAGEAAKQQSDPSGEDSRPGAKAGGGVSVGGEYRRQKLQQVMALLERENALVEGVMERLGRLQGV